MNEIPARDLEIYQWMLRKVEKFTESMAHEFLCYYAEIGASEEILEMYSKILYTELEHRGLQAQKEEE